MMTDDELINLAIRQGITGHDLDAYPIADDMIYVTCRCGCAWRLIFGTFQAVTIAEDSADFHLLDDYANPREGDGL